MLSGTRNNDLHIHTSPEATNSASRVGSDERDAGAGWASEVGNNLSVDGQGLTRAQFGGTSQSDANGAGALVRLPRRQRTSRATSSEREGADQASFGLGVQIDREWTLGCGSQIALKVLGSEVPTMVVVTWRVGPRTGPCRIA